MAQRSIRSGSIPTVVIKAGGSLVVKGVDGDSVSAASESKWGLQVEKRSENEFARARAVLGEFVLFDWRLKTPGAKDARQIIAVQLSGSGQVLVPYNSNLKIYAGGDIDVQEIQGQVDAFAGMDLIVQNVHMIGSVSAGGALFLDCETLREEKNEFSSGGDLRFFVHDLTSAHFRVKEMGDLWEAQIGTGERLISLKSGGEVTLVTGQTVKPLPPNYILGKIERQPAS
jgi:hypothetical protein